MENPLDNGVTPRHPAPRWAEWGALLFAGAVLVVFRLHAFGLPLETDECNYAYIGSRLLESDRLYVDVWDHQPFGVFGLFAGVIAVFGDAPIVFRCLATVFSLVSLSLVYLLLRRRGGTGPAFLGAMLFAIASSDPGTAGEGCNREIYMNTLILAAWYFALRQTPTASWLMFASGCALAIASSVKTIVAIHWAFLAAWIIWDTWRTVVVSERVKSIAKALLVFAAGPLILWVGASAYFGATGRWSEFVDAVFLFNLSYSGSAEGFFTRFVDFFSPPRHPFAFDSALPLWIGAVGAILWLIVDAAAHRSRDALAILFLTIAGYIAVCLPNRFWPHYYYLLIPAAVIAVSMFVGYLANWSQRSIRSTSIGSSAAGFIYAVVPILLLVTEYREYLHQPHFGITVKRYNSRDFWGRAQGEKVRQVTDPGDEIFVFGHDTSIYYYSKRKCASRFTMITGLQSVYSRADERRAILMDELRERPPRLILVLFDEKPFPEWRAFLEEYYTEPIGWDFKDGTQEPIMFVVARKDKPVKQIDWNWDRSEAGGW